MIHQQIPQTKAEGLTTTQVTTQYSQSPITTTQNIDIFPNTTTTTQYTTTFPTSQAIQYTFPTTGENHYTQLPIAETNQYIQSPTTTTTTTTTHVENYLPTTTNTQITSTYQTTGLEQLPTTTTTDYTNYLPETTTTQYTQSPITVNTQNNNNIQTTTTTTQYTQSPITTTNQYINAFPTTTTTTTTNYNQYPNILASTATETTQYTQAPVSTSSQFINTFPTTAQTTTTQTPVTTTQITNSNPTTQYQNSFPTTAQYTNSTPITATTTTQYANTFPTTTQKATTQYVTPQTTTTIQNTPVTGVIPTAAHQNVPATTKGIAPIAGPSPIPGLKGYDFVVTGQPLKAQNPQSIPLPKLTPQQHADSHFVSNFPIYESDPRRIQYLSNRRASYDAALGANQGRYGYNNAGVGIGAKPGKLDDINANNRVTPSGLGVNVPQVVTPGVTTAVTNLNKVGTGLTNLKLSTFNKT